MKDIIAKLLEIAKLIFGFLFSKTKEEVEIPEEEYEDPPVINKEEEINKNRENSEDNIIDNNTSGSSEEVDKSISDLIEDDNSITTEVPIKGLDYYSKQNEITITTLPKEDIAHHIINTEFDEEDMFWFFVNEGMNYYGASGLMGNLFAECGLRSNNLQDYHSKKFGMTDEEYTTAVDNGTYHNFVGDSAGYGLAQWTYWTRKQNLLDYAVSTERSIGDARMQCEFLMKELRESYKTVLFTLMNATSVLEASNAVLLKFEKPYDQSEDVQEKRASFGIKYYKKYTIV